MNSDTFEELIRLVSPGLKKRCTRLRKSLSVEEKVACTLRFLATGESYYSLQYQFRISKGTISLFIPEVCSAICSALKDIYLPFPKTDEEWLQISNDIYKHWQFTNAIGAIDGKHFYIYKKFYSVVLMAVVKHSYQFICECWMPGQIE